MTRRLIRSEAVTFDGGCACQSGWIYQFCKDNRCPLGLLCKATYVAATRWRSSLTARDERVAAMDRRAEGYLFLTSFSREFPSSAGARQSRLQRNGTVWAHNGVYWPLLPLHQHRQQIINYFWVSDKLETHEISLEHNSWNLHLSDVPLCWCSASTPWEGHSLRNITGLRRMIPNVVERAWNQDSCVLFYLLYSPFFFDFESVEADPGRRNPFAFLLICSNKRANWFPNDTNFGRTHVGTNRITTATQHNSRPVGVGSSPVDRWRSREAEEFINFDSYSTARSSLSRQPMSTMSTAFP